MRLWFRQPARTSQAGQPLPTPAKAGRSSRAVLRLEACEDRTATSAVTAGPEPVWDVPPALVGDAKPGDATESSEPVGPVADQSPETFGKADGGQSSMMDGKSPSPAAQLPPTTGGQVPHFGRFGGGSEADRLESPATPQPEKAPRADQPETTAGRSESASPASTPAAPDQAVARTDRSSRSDEKASTSAAGTAVVAPAAPAPHQATKALTAAQRARAATADAIAAPAQNRVTSATQFSTTYGSAHADVLHADVTDGTLLQRFVANREQAAFAALVQRHGGFVLGVCHRVLGDFHAAQDAVQATFLVLARKAGMLDRSGPLGGWLYKVAYHLALRSRGVAARQRLTERAADPSDTTAEPAPESDLEMDEVRRAIREELEHLPEKYRAPLMLCYFDGRTHADAAREIGVPRGSMAKRIGEGLECLRERLMDRGLTF